MTEKPGYEALEKKPKISAGKIRDKFVSIRMSPHFREERVIGLIASIKDITERKRAKELKQLGLSDSGGIRMDCR